VTDERRKQMNSIENAVWVLKLTLLPAVRMELSLILVTHGRLGLHRLDNSNSRSSACLIIVLVVTHGHVGSRD
jgi:hypothetical protein